MRKVSFTRHLKPSEVTLARLVFHDALPYSQIGITDGLGKDDTVWTHDRSLIPFSSFVTSSFQYYVNFGDGANADLSVPGVPLRTLVPGYDRSEMVSQDSYPTRLGSFSGKRKRVKPTKRIKQGIWAVTTRFRILYTFLP